MCRRRIVAKVSSLLLSTLAFGSLCQAEDQSFEVPFEWKGGHLVVRGSIGDLTDLNLVIDTGASSTTVSKRIARKLGLKGEKKQATAHGHRIDVEQVRLPSLQMGSLLREDIPAWSMDRLTVADARQMFRIDALIGLDLLRRTNLTIDFEKQIVRFGPVHVGEDFQAFYPALPFLVMRISVGGETLGVMLDSGAEDLILYERRVGHRLAIGPSRGSKEVRHAGGKTRLRKVRLSKISIGTTEWSELEAFLMEGGAGDSGLDGVLGIRALGLKRLTVDFRVNRIGWLR